MYRAIYLQLTGSIGSALTVMALYMATRQFRRGNKQSMNHWLRFRVAAQGFTILAICAYGFAIRRERARAKEAGEETAVFVQPLNERKQRKEKKEFEQRMEDAVKAEEEVPLKDDGKVDWKAAWKAGLLKKNAENDEKRVRPVDRT